MHIRSANSALQQGNAGQALAHFIQAVNKAPQNHRYKVRLCEFLKNIGFPNHELHIQKTILNLLQTKNLEHQRLWQPWLSLILNDPEAKAFQKLMNNQDYVVSELQDYLENAFFLAGLEKFICLNIQFERALKEIKELIDNKKIKSEKFLKAFNTYNYRTENLLDETPFKLDYTPDKTIPTLSKTKNKTSLEVQDQYEHNPYPRWTSCHLIPVSAKPDQIPYDHLIAGCGTGYSTCMTAMLYPHAKITAFDLSLASLTYAKKKANELGFNDVDFFQADILDLKDLDKKFDLIECSGVLHHMRDPLEGWKSLIKKLKPDGKMHIGLYSELGRADVVAARKFIQQEQFPATPEGIKTARHAIAKLPEDHPARGVLNRNDFYSLSGCRDLIFHVQEHRFTIPKIKESLDKLGLSFSHFNIDSMVTHQLYKKTYPQDTTMSNLDNWDALERNNPDLFRGMYQFWCHFDTE